MKNLLIILFIAAFLAITAVVSHNYFDELRNGGPSGENLVANSALEHPQPNDAKKPYGWQNGRWGDNIVRFDYLESGGINNSRAVKVALSRYRSGDAKWYFDYIKVQGGQRYRFTDWYRSDANSTVTLYTDTENTVLNLNIPPAENWTRIEITFAMPVDTTRATVFHLLSSNGNLTTDNYSLAPVGFEETERGFRSGIVSFVFVSGKPDAYWSAAKTIGMEPYYWKGTFYVKPEFAADDPKYYRDGRFIDRIAWFGNEMGLDTASLGNGSDLKEIDKKIAIAKARWQITGPIASPAQTNKIPEDIVNLSDYGSILILEDGINTPAGFNRYRLFSINGDTIDLSEFEKTVTQANQEGSWLIIRYCGAPPKDQLDWLLANGINPVTVKEALEEIEPQLPD